MVPLVLIYCSESRILSAVASKWILQRKCVQSNCHPKRKSGLFIQDVYNLGTGISDPSMISFADHNPVSARLIENCYDGGRDILSSACHIMTSHPVAQTTGKLF